MKPKEMDIYKVLFEKVVSIIGETRIKAYKSLTKYQLSLNFEIGKLIVDSQTKHGWGKHIVTDLSKDINQVIDGITGYSPQNLWRMRQFYLEYREDEQLKELAFQVPWGQNLLIIQKIKDNVEKQYYLKATIEMGWSRAVLLNQIKANAYQHPTKAEYKIIK
jgi:predicted nuclease of restriction endonuclease-like (RecB) superfamily